MKNDTQRTAAQLAFVAVVAALLAYAVTGNIRAALLAGAMPLAGAALVAVFYRPTA